MQKFENQERMTPAEAEEVIRRFRDEEEVRQKEMEAQATNPTVADLAEGLGVPTERINYLLAQVRRDSVPPTITVEEAKAEVRRQNSSAWGLAIVILVLVFVVGAFAAMFMTTATTIETPAPEAPLRTERATRYDPPPIEQPTPESSR